MMKDRQSAAIVIAMAAIGFILWYRSRSLVQKANLFGVLPSGPDSAGDRAALKIPKGVPVLPAVGVDMSGMTPLQRLLSFAGQHGLIVTSTTGGSHVRGSMHYLGRAIDVRTRGKSQEFIEDVMAAARNAGFRVLDERADPGHGKWTGPHLHIEDRR